MALVRLVLSGEKVVLLLVVVAILVSLGPVRGHGLALSCESAWVIIRLSQCGSTAVVSTIQRLDAVRVVC